MKALYRMNIDCGRNGNLHGIFVAEQEDVKILIEHRIEVYFGEVLGKHSDIYGCIENKELEEITTEANVIEVIEQYDLETGFNPFYQTITSDELDNYNLDINKEYLVMDIVDIIKNKKG